MVRRQGGWWLGGHSGSLWWREVAKIRDGEGVVGGGSLRRVLRGRLVMVLIHFFGRTCG